VISGSCDSRACEAYALDRNSPATCELGGDTVICTQRGQEYYILVEGQNKETGEFILRVRDTQLACDEGPYTPCSNALAIQADVEVPVVIKDYPPVMITDCELITSPEGSRAFANAAFFRFVAPDSAQYRVDLCSGLSGNFDIEVYEGDCASASCFGTSRLSDGTCPSDSEQESQTFCTTAGQTYIIVLHSGYGRVSLRLRSEGSCTVPCVPVCEQGTSCVGDTCGGLCGTCSGSCMDGVCVPDPVDVPCPSPAPPSRSAVSVTPRSPTPVLSLSPAGQPSIINASPSPALQSVSVLPSSPAAATSTRTASASRNPNPNPSFSRTPLPDSQTPEPEPSPEPTPAISSSALPPPPPPPTMVSPPGEVSPSPSPLAVTPMEEVSPSAIPTQTARPTVQYDDDDNVDIDLSVDSSSSLLVSLALVVTLLFLSH